MHFGIAVSTGSVVLLSFLSQLQHHVTKLSISHYVCYTNLDRRGCKLHHDGSSEASLEPQVEHVYKIIWILDVKLVKLFE